MKQVTIPAQCLLDWSSQHDHGGYPCMGINTSLSVQETWHLLSRVWPARLLLPAFLLSSIHFPLYLTSLTFNQMDYWQKWSFRLNCQSNILTYLALDAKPSKLIPHWAAWCLGTSLRFYRSWSQPQQRQRQWQRPGPRHWRLKKKTTETEARSTLATVYACTVCRRPIPGKI